MGNKIYKKKGRTDPSGKVVVKVFWLTSIILSILLTLILNLVFSR